MFRHASNHQGHFHFENHSYKQIAGALSEASDFSTSYGGSLPLTVQTTITIKQQTITHWIIHYPPKVALLTEVLAFPSQLLMLSDAHAREMHGSRLEQSKV